MKMTLELLDPRVGADPESAELLAAIHKWLDRLQHLTDDLLEYGRTWSVNLEPGLASEALHPAIDVCRARALDRGVTIDLQEPPAMPPILMDAGRLTHVFENLLTNAIQYSASGGRVAITADSDEASVEYAFRDHGPGFLEADLPRVFQPFFTRRRGGTGLGLSIVQRIMEEHGGTVIASNHEEGGALVRARLPRYRPELRTKPREDTGGTPV
jgi:signal transduction histidine kinase